MAVSRLIYLIVSVFLWQSVFSQQDKKVLESLVDYDTILKQQANFELDEVSISSPLLHQRYLTAPSSISRIKGEDLLLQGSFSYVDQLEQVPGVFVQSGTSNTVRISIRGIGSRTPYGTNRIKAYLNNIPLTSGEGYSQIEDLDPVFLGTISVTKGAKSALYGNGLGGIIMLETSKSNSEKLNLSAGIEYGSYNTIHPYIQIGTQTANTSLSIGYSFINSDGWRENNFFCRHNVYADYRIKGGNSNTTILLYYIDNYAKIPSSLNEEMFYNSPEKAAPNWLAVNGFEKYGRLLSGLNHTHQLNKYWLLDAGISISSLDAYESRPFNILDDNSWHISQKTMLSYKRQNYVLRGGYEFQMEKYKWLIYETNEGNQGELLSDFSELRYPISLHFQAEIRWGNTIVEGGLGYSMHKYKLVDNYTDSLDLSGDYQFDPVISPFLGLNFPVGSKIRIYTSIGHGISYPDVMETILPDYKINTKIKPETGLNLEAGLRGSILSNNFFFDLSVYRMHVKNLLLIKRESEDVFYGENAGRSIHQGLELAINNAIVKEARQNVPEIKFFLALNLTDNRFADYKDDDQDYSGNYLPGLPSVMINMGVEIFYLKGFYFLVNNKWQNKQYLDDANTAVYGAYNLTAAKLGYRLKVAHRNSLNFFLGVNNIFDTHYASMVLVNAPSFGSSMPRYYYPGSPRNWYLGVKWEF